MTGRGGLRGVGKNLDVTTFKAFVVFLGLAFWGFAFFWGFFGHFLVVLPLMLIFTSLRMSAQYCSQRLTPMPLMEQSCRMVVGLLWTIPRSKLLSNTETGGTVLVRACSVRNVFKERSKAGARTEKAKDVFIVRSKRFILDVLPVFR